MSTAAESLRVEVEAAIKDRRVDTLNELGGEPVLWLAAPPVWTLAAAEAAGFPASPVIEFVRRACDAGWCKARGPLRDDAPGDLTFWMPGEVRREVVDVLRDRVREEVITRSLKRVADSVHTFLVRPGTWREIPRLAEDALPEALTAWAALMEEFPDASAVSAGLVLQAQQSVAAGDLSRAQDLVAAGEAIAGMLAGNTEQALSRARRLLGLGRRRRQDERALGRYLDRPELSVAVARLLSQDGPGPESAAGEAAEIPWALHLRGAGGVGKTMLIRYLASGRYAAERGRPPILVARADFDNISADYPVRRPVQLLLELADELALHAAASDRADRALSAFRARAARAHEAVSGLREAGGSPLRHEDVARAVDSFGDVLVELDGGLLILDTCEELAKADLGNPATPAVRAMLDIIERLHERAPSMRVLVAGRRPLPERPYLAVQPVAGFTAAEARRYLAESAARPLPGDLADAMIRQSAAVDGPVPAPGQLPERVSPFDLALYAAWADEDPGLDVAQVRQGSDAYVEGRIIERLGDPLVARALPVLAAAGRCRVATIAEFIGGDADALGRRLAQHEWIDADGDPPVHVMAKPALARRLRRYFESGERQASFAVTTSRLASALVGRLREDPPAGTPGDQQAGVRPVPLTDIDADELIAALRLAEPADAAALWDGIAERAIEPPGHWGTVLNITRRVLGAWDEEEWPTTPALRATVTAAHIAASRRDSPLFDARGPWKTVRAWAPRHPRPHSRWSLGTRAALGLLEDTPDTAAHSLVIRNIAWFTQGDLRVMILLELRPAPGDADFTSSAPLATPVVATPVVAAAVIGTVHRLLEAGSPLAARWFDAAPRPAEADADRTGNAPGTHAMVAWGLVARARVFADSDETAAGRALAEAERLAAAVTDPEPSWPDWVPPDDLLARVRIERGLIAPPEDPAVLDEWESYAAGHLDSIDGERLASLCLRIRLRHGAADAAVAARWEAADRYAADRVPSGTAHHLVPPLFVSVAQAWLSAGQAERALALLDRRRGEALGTRQDDLTVRHADAATIAIVRRLRLADRQSLLTGQAFGRPRWPAPDSRWHALRAMAVLGIAPGTLSLEDPASWHAWWQSVAPGAALTLSGFPPSVQHWRAAHTSAELADIGADLEEMRQLFPAAGDDAENGLGQWQNWLADWLRQPAPSAPPVRTAEPYPELRAAMRMAALARSQFTPPPAAGHRLLAEIAFEEAELMALRRPGPAAALFTLAAGEYAKADDVVGEFLARLSVRRVTPGGGAPGRGLPDAAEAAQAADAALSRLRERNPLIVAALTGTLQDAGPWRYWAEAVQGAGDEPAPGSAAEATEAAEATGQGQAPPDLQPSPGAGAAPGGTVPRPPGDARALAAAPSSVPRPSRRTSWVRFRLVAVVLTAAAAIGAGVLASIPARTATSAPTGPPGGSGGGTPVTVWIAGSLAGLAVLAALLGWCVPKVMRLAAGRGIGAVRPGLLLLELGGDTRPPPSTLVHLQARARPWGTAPRRARAMLWLVIPAVRLGTRFHLMGNPYGLEANGYDGEISSPGLPGEQAGIRWDLPRPAAAGAWWRRGRGTALGIIRGSALHGPDPATAWERILVASLGEGASGRVEWIRLLFDARMYTTRAAGSRLTAPVEWDRPLRQHYGPPRGAEDVIGLRHVIGRAVDSSAGPVMDISGGAGAATTSAGEGSLRLHGVIELKHGQPAIVVLQAEPAPDDTIGPEPPDDQAEKLRLGVELARDGVPAVLLLPVLPASIVAGLAQIIATHANGAPGGDAQRLLSRLRAAIAPHVPPPVLDDVVLFLNAVSYRS